MAITAHTTRGEGGGGRVCERKWETEKESAKWEGRARKTSSQYSSGQGEIERANGQIGEMAENGCAKREIASGEGKNAKREGIREGRVEASKLRREEGGNKWKQKHRVENGQKG